MFACSWSATRVSSAKKYTAKRARTKSYFVKTPSPLSYYLVRTTRTTRTNLINQRLTTWTTLEPRPNNPNIVLNQWLTLDLVPLRPPCPLDRIVKPRWALKYIVRTTRTRTNSVERSRIVKTKYDEPHPIPTQHILVWDSVDYAYTVPRINNTFISQILTFP